MQEAFEFKTIDMEGMATLEAIANANNFNQWMYAVTSKNLTGRILEVGSGIGNISERYVRDGRDIFLSDIRDNYCGHLRERFGANPHCKGVRNIDLVHPQFETEYSDLLASFDGVFALNVVEHIQDDSQAVANATKLLKKGGRLVVLVPAYQSLYNNFDRALEHYRRYTEGSLKHIFTKNNLQVTDSQYFNCAAIAGWWFSGSLMKKEVIPSGQMKVYDMLVPVFKIVDAVLMNKVGISVIVQGIKD